MTKGKLFEYAVIYHPKPKKAKEGEEEQSSKSVLVSEVTTVLAASSEEVGILAARSIPEKYLDKLEQVEIVIRPF
jgi:hypothetical protein